MISWVFYGVCAYTCMWRPEEDVRCCPLKLFILFSETWLFPKSEALTILGFTGRTTRGPVISDTQCFLVNTNMQAFLCVCCRFVIVSSYLLSMHPHPLMHVPSLLPLLWPSGSHYGGTTHSSEIQARQNTRILSKSWLPTSLVLHSQIDSDFK